MIQRRTQAKILDMSIFVCVTSIEALTHTAVLHRSDILGDEAVGTLVDEATRLVVGYLQVGAVQAAPFDRRTRKGS